MDAAVTMGTHNGEAIARKIFSFLENKGVLALASSSSDLSSVITEQNNFEV